LLSMIKVSLQPASYSLSESEELSDELELSAC
jgi:hypothetical protein